MLPSWLLARPPKTRTMPMQKPLCCGSPSSRPELIVPWVELGLAQLGLKKYPEAENSFKMAISTAPSTQFDVVGPASNGVSRDMATRTELVTKQRQPDVLGTAFASLGRSIFMKGSSRRRSLPSIKRLSPIQPKRGPIERVKRSSSTRLATLTHSWRRRKRRLLLNPLAPNPISSKLRRLSQRPPSIRKPKKWSFRPAAPMLFANTFSSILTVSSPLTLRRFSPPRHQQNDFDRLRARHAPYLADPHLIAALFANLVESQSFASNATSIFAGYMFLRPPTQQSLTMLRRPQRSSVASPPRAK